MPEKIKDKIKDNPIYIRIRTEIIYQMINDNPNLTFWILDIYLKKEIKSK